MRPPKQLSEKSLHAAWRYLTHKDLDLLGDWRFDKSLLQEINRKVIGNSVGVIDNFFAPAHAETLYNETVQLAASGVNFGDPIERTPLGPVGKKAYDKTVDPNSRCVLMYQTPPSNAFFQYNVLEAAKLELPGRVATKKLFQNRKWIKGWTILLTGTDKGTDNLSMSIPYFREYRAGDYINIHTDASLELKEGVHRERRLCFNYWTPSPDWDPEWGGSFVWCGPGAKNPHGPGPHFPSSFRAATRYNQAGIFVPTDHSFHIVDQVSDTADPSRHRFSFTSWLEEAVPPPASAVHQLELEPTIQLEL